METWQTLFGVVMMLTITDCVGQISITSKPQNVAGVISSTQEFVLPCSISSPGGPPTIYTWSDSNPGEIYIGDAKQESHVHSQYFGLKNPEISEQWTDYDLRVKTPVLNVADTYTCLGLQSGDTVEASADVLLLETEPACYQNNTDENEYGVGDSVLMLCTVNFTGAWSPSITWYDGDGQEVVGVTFNDNFTVAHYLVLEVAASKDQEVFTCKVKFGEPPGPITSAQATNAPDFVSECTLNVNCCRGSVSSLPLLTIIASAYYALI